MRKEPLKVPRASLGVTLLDDPEWIEACETSAGRDAALLFVALILAAKTQNNGGCFTQSDSVAAMLVRWPLADFKSALEYLLNMPGEWVRRHDGALLIRSFSRWNAGWGGAREGAGRPPAQDSSADSSADSSRNQEKPNPLVPASASASRTTTTCTEPAKPVAVPSDLKDLELYAQDPKLCKEWPALKAALQQANPGVDVVRELRKAHAWEVANKTRRKRNRAPFLHKWLARSQDRAGSGTAKEPSWGN